MHQWISKVQTSSYGNAAVISDKVMIVRQTTMGPTIHKPHFFLISLIITTQTFVDFLLTDLFLLKLPLFIDEPLAFKHKKIAQKLKITQKISLFFRNMWYSKVHDGNRVAKKKMQSKQCIKGNKTTGNLISSSNLNCTFVLHH